MSEISSRLAEARRLVAAHNYDHDSALMAALYRAEKAEAEVARLQQYADDLNDQIADCRVLEYRAKVARVESLAATDGIWKGEKHVRLTRRDPRLGCDITESYVRVDDLRAALAKEP